MIQFDIGNYALKDIIPVKDRVLKTADIMRKDSRRRSFATGKIPSSACHIKLLPAVSECHPHPATATADIYFIDGRW
ncbi:MAG: hypothetical protein JW944_01155 [Deltaproteobacteria bacterium]|nr:hypothetical protein [Deltaproteobacteria bacterium]